MVSKISVVVVLVVAVCMSTSFNGVAGMIMCYNCTSYPNNTACSDPMGDAQMINCPDNYYCTKVKYSTQGYDVTSRSCDPKSSTTCQDIQTTLNRTYSDLSGYGCWACETDHCNSAVTFGAPLVAMVVTLLVAKLV